MTTIARPYAHAAFENALGKNDLLAWEAMLTAAALVTEDHSVQQVLMNPALNCQQHADLYCDVLVSLMDVEKKNFLHLLAENQRLIALPDIAALFKQYRAEHQKTITVQVVSAVELDQQYKDKLAVALTQKLQRNVTLQCTLDPNLIGGAIITAGDTVIDGSVRGKLDRMVECLSGNS